jgi:Na+:H+ antiporter
MISSHSEVVFLVLFIVATAVALVARRLNFPYTIALVVAGLVLGGIHALEAPHLTQELLYSVILPGLLFEAAFHLDFRDFWQNRLAIDSLAVIGVAASIAITAGILAAAAHVFDVMGGFSVVDGVVFGAVVAATDPIAVVGLFKTLGAPRRLRVLVEGESLLNDGTSLVLFTLILGVLAGGEFSAIGMATEFVRVVGTGVLVGGVVGFVISRIIRHVDDPMIEITLTTIAAYGSFLLGENLHGSGVIATVTAGMLSGNYGARIGMSPSTRIAVETFWEYVAFALNSIVFLLIGFEVKVGALISSWQPILAAYAAMVAARALVVVGVTGALRKTRECIPWRWSPALVWSGLRGALSMVLVLGLASGFPHRSLLVTITFGVVVLTILVQGLTMAPLLEGLGLATGGHQRRDYEVHRGQLLATRAALRELRRMRREVSAPPGVLDALQKEYEQRQRSEEEEIRSLDVDEGDFRGDALRAARRQLLLVEKDSLIESLRRGRMEQGSYEKLIGDVDARLTRVESGETEPEPERKAEDRSPAEQHSGKGAGQ